MVNMTHSILVTAVCILFCGAAFAAPPSDPYQQVLDLQKQARAGDAGAQYLLGFMYAEGQGVAKDEAEALKWYTKAAEQGHADAQLSLAMMYAEGRGTAKDDKQAIKWYTKAAEQGNANVQVILAAMLANAGGTDQLIEAYKWTLLAEAGGKDVADQQAALRDRLTAEQVAEAEKRAAAFGKPLDPNGPVRVIAKAEGFEMVFPSPPEKTVVQDNDRLLAIHYRAMPNNSPVQYNASFQYFKKQKILGDAAQAAFIEDYLVGRAMFAWKNRIQKKELTFRGCHATLYKHTTHTGGTETVHEGLVFLMNGDCICLSCVYPASTTPNPTFDEFISAFQRVDPPADPNML